LKNLEKAELDEIELYLRILEKQPEKIKFKTCFEIAKIIQNEFGVKCNEKQIFLLYEPTIDTIIEDNEFYYKEVLGL